VLHDTNLAETKGSGVRVMRELMIGVGLTPPTFESDRQRDGFVVTCLFHHFLTQEDWDWLAHFTDAALSDEEARALVFARETGAINNLAYRTLNRVDVLNASQHLRRLRDRGLLQQKGKGAETYYLPTPKLMDCWGTPGEAAPGHSGQSGRSTAQTSKAGGQSGSSTPQYGSTAFKSGRHPSRLRFLPGLPADLESDLAQLKGKVPQPEMEALAWRLCVWRSLSSKELAQALGRSRKYINDRLITPMLRTGRLERTIPDRPSDPQQTYRAVIAKSAKEQPEN
jgi:ATP-dependent DNA helicase RecG